jgi:hypothetical protein
MVAESILFGVELARMTVHLEFCYDRAGAPVSITRYGPTTLVAVGILNQINFGPGGDTAAGYIEPTYGNGIYEISSIVTSGLAAGQWSLGVSCTMALRVATSGPSTRVYHHFNTCQPFWKNRHSIPSFTTMRASIALRWGTGFYRIPPEAVDRTYVSFTPPSTPRTETDLRITFPDYPEEEALTLSTASPPPGIEDTELRTALHRLAQSVPNTATVPPWENTCRGHTWRAPKVFVSNESADTGCRGRLYMGADGNLVIYGRLGNPLWATGTSGWPGARAEFQGDGNLVVYSPSGVPLWASNTTNAAGGRLDFQADGNLVIYAAAGNPVWATNTFG